MSYLKKIRIFLKFKTTHKTNQMYKTCSIDFLLIIQNFFLVFAH